MPIRRAVGLAIPLIAASLVAAPALAEESPLRFSQHVRPILSDKCFQCHGPDGESRAAGVRLDVPGEVDVEEIVARVESVEPGYRMPPEESHKSLSSSEITILKRWVGQGAPYERHWAFEPIARSETPPGLVDWSRGEIDRFVAEQWKQRAMTPRPRASKRTLVRRLALDLTGLPPTRDMVESFVSDDREDAYERLVDRLLASPHHGEHLSRYWLDLVRYGDTNGLHHDHYRQMTPYRDWVIRAFNDNLPFDEFLSYQIAGDLYEDPTIDQQIASAFNRLHLIIDVGTALPEESLHRNVIDRTATFGAAMLGLTVECAACHDHKYDPITQRDFYQLYAFFNNFDGEPETGRRGTLDFRRGLQPPYLELPSEEQTRAIAALEHRLETLEAKIASVPEGAQTAEPDEAATLAETSRAIASEGNRDETEAQIKATRQELDLLRCDVPAALVMKERAEPRPAYLYARGQYDAPGEQVQRGTPAFLQPMSTGASRPTRLDLAGWLIDDKNPLPARVAANRFWQYLFGVGLVETSEDFGAQGTPPSHPELLDYLASRFVESSWDVRELLREIVLSETYRQSSDAATEAYAADPRNRWLARGSRYRLDAEVIRDQALAVSGMLDRTLLGQAVNPPQPPGLWKAVTMPSSYPKTYEADTGDAARRRSVYTFWKRGLPPPTLTVFDAPTREACVARRERTNTPLQALLLMNEEQQFEAARRLANHLLVDPSADDATTLRVAYESVVVAQPSEQTLVALGETLDGFRGCFEADLEGAVAVSGELSDKAIEQAAWTMVVHCLLNLDQTRNRD